MAGGGGGGGLPRVTKQNISFAKLVARDNDSHIWKAYTSICYLRVIIEV